jgi:chemotaxis protein methyltransferase CheR
MITKMPIVLTKTNFDKLSSFIYRRSGISLSLDNHFDKLQTVVAKRTDVLNYKTFRQYFSMIRFEDKDEKEFQELINCLTVNETYFFRENYQFECLVHDILPEIHALKRKDQPIRILSAPCSTGEEAYSIAIHLLEDNDLVNKRDIEIVGIDIDSNVIESALQGQYSNRSIHTLSNELQEKYFEKKGAFNYIDEDLIDAIDFKVANVFNKKDIRKLGKFDVIFSRNMLIYFDDSSRKEVAMTFYDILNSNGYVLLGHAEYMNRIVSVFKPIKFDKAIVYKK